ncbi:MAG: ribonucleoside triphosphate reductase, partial [Candidatus Atribacteria bacterium]|nr:ribonucleoside triphosphate reductase [Candidatus Atribacteria bacterium]
DLQALYTGGTVFHSFLSETPDPQTVMLFIRRTFEKYPIPYLTVTPTFSVCQNHGYISGRVFHCPECGAETEVYSRVVGYYRPVQRWNQGKREEFRQRREYAVNNL